jgi:SAM-dependent methyltransferase
MSAVLNSFSRAAANYDLHAQVQRDMADWLAEWLPVERVGRALEIGAGTGNFTKRVGGWPEGLVATDMSPLMCERGRIAVPDAEWCVMKAEQPEGGPWGWILSSAMLQWVENPGQVFSALGALFAAESLVEWRAIAGENGPIRWRAVEEWRTAFASGGLRLLRDEVETRVFSYPSSCAFLRSLHGVGAAPERHFTGSRLRELLREMDAKSGGMGVEMTWNFYRFEAERDR